ncbi:MAG: glycerophosphodiester phosphodiesterase [Planctomycetes bacterium]|nr:glycerophosphodiester phosphodiesterase [Planctomycetota bacterium]
MIQVIGHRGAAGLEPENTLRSYRKALEIGVDYVETDVYLTQDKHLIVMHDRTVDRTTNGTGSVEEMTFDEIRELDAGEGEQVPTLREVLELIKGKAKIHIELKGEGTPKPVVDTVREMDMVPDVVITSGNTERVKEVKGLCPDVAVEHIYGDPPPDAVERAVSAGAGRVSVNIRHITQEYVDAAHAAGLLVIAWPPNTEEEINHALSFGVDLICSDRPDVAMKVLGRA